MDEREELARLIWESCSWWAEHDDGGAYETEPPSMACEKAADAILAAGWRRIAEPGSAEWEAMVERAALELWECGASRYWLAPKWEDEDASIRKSFRENAEAALRAALGLDQPHRENDERPEEQP